VGLTLVAGLVITSQMMIRERLVSSTTETREESVLNQQRLSCHQLVLLVGRMLSSEAETREQAKSQLAEAAKRIEDDGSSLIDLVTDDAIGGGRGSVGQGPLQLASTHRTSLVQAARTLIPLVGDASRKDECTAAIATLILEHAELERALGMVQAAFDAQNHSVTHEVADRTRNLSLAMLLALVAVAWFVMEPAVRRVTKAHATHEEQKEELERLALVAMHTHSAVVLCDSQQRITWTNPGFERISGYTLEQSLGRSPYVLLEASAEGDVIADLVTFALAEGQPCRDEVKCRRQDGLEYWADLEVQPLKDASGKVTGFMMLQTERTEQVKLRESLQGSEERVRLIVDTALDAVIELDRIGNVTMWNAQAERIFGYTSEEAWGKNLASLLFEPHMAEAFQDSIDAYANDGDQSRFSTRVELIGRDRNGRTFPVEQAVSPHTVQGEVTFSIFMRDIADRKAAQAAIERARDEAEAANRAKSDFLANMSHEIRTPMTAMLGYADLLADQGASLSNQERGEYIETIKRNGNHLLSIINDILDIAKIEAGKMTVERIDIEPIAIAKDVASLFKAKAAAVGVELELKQNGRLPAVILGDPVRFRQILMNLVGNAVKFTQAGRITLECELDGSNPLNGMLSIRVRDTGVGMTPEQLSRLFRAFEQADTTMTRRFGGTGLGLRIAKRLAELMGGSLTVTSAEGVGSTFTFTIPAGAMQLIRFDADAEHHAPVASAPAAAPAVSLAGVRILLMEDGPDNQRLISFHLRKAGAIVTIADNGRIGVEMLSSDGTIMGSLKKKADFDIVLSDMQMPELDGYSAAQWLRSRGFDLPIIALTAHAMSGDAQKCIEAGCDAYATKPVDRTQLLRLCRDAMDGKIRKVRQAA
jgi:PAS domain S-box-containing protein